MLAHTTATFAFNTYHLDDGGGYAIVLSVQDTTDLLADADRLGVAGDDVTRRKGHGNGSRLA